ncbi:hypothetical protein [Candidatus Solirubrobacter pratensis]|uniref:hypothetical protein n=1 Tax=Candidatus Solirubrobacter pratensis TaxID=1298857 RepID=UPI0003FB6D28|nr:hypothetical protein [Candidatus Solirubrobacter pratensis]
MTFADVARAFEGEPDVTRGRGFAREVLKREGKIFAIDYEGAVVFKLPADRCAALVSETSAVPFDRGQGKPLREWVVVRESDAWLPLAHEALAFARSPS